MLVIPEDGVRVVYLLLATSDSLLLLLLLLLLGKLEIWKLSRTLNQCELEIYGMVYGGEIGKWHE